jgi:hypothetical protein
MISQVFWLFQNYIDVGVISIHRDTVQRGRLTADH